MRLPPFPSARLFGGFPAETLDGRTSDGQGLLGSWSATRWQYSAPDGRRQDVVCDLGATITLSISSGTWVLSLALPGGSSRSIGGTWVEEPGELRFTPLDAEPATLLYRISGELLSLSTETVRGISRPATRMSPPGSRRCWCGCD